MTALGWILPPLLLGVVAWMVARERRRPPSRLRRLLLYPVFAVLGLVAAGCGVETVLSAADRPVPLAGGQRLVDVGGHRLAIACRGQGSPAVVLEPGLGETARAMARLIAPAVARTTRVCVYDRAGHGRSDATAGGPADGARDLHVLMARRGIPGPFVIAGHSLGGIHALNHARRYPEDVAGIVLIDSMHPQETSTFEGADPILDLLPALARTGVGRLLFDTKDGAPVAQTRALVRDMKAMPAQLDQAAQLKDLGARPLAVVSAGTGGRPGWAADQARLAKLSTSSVHRTIPGATHASLIEDEAGAAESSRAIRDVVAAVR